MQNSRAQCGQQLPRRFGGIGGGRDRGADRDAGDARGENIGEVVGADPADGEGRQANLGGHGAEQIETGELGKRFVPEGNVGPTPM